MGDLPAMVAFTVLWPAMLPWLAAAIVPLLIAVWPLRHPDRIRWGATELIATAARRAGVNRSGVPVVLVALRSLLLVAAALAAARPFLAPRADTPGLPIVAGVVGRRIEVVVPQPAAAAAVGDNSLALRRGLEALAASPSTLRRSGMPAVDVVHVEQAAMPFQGRRLIVLCDGAVPGERDAARVAAAVRDGASLLVCAGPESMATAARPRLSAWLDTLAGISLASAVPLRHAGIDAGDLAVEAAAPLLPGATVSGMAELVFDPRAWTVLARTTEGGRPLIVERTVGEGRVCVSSIPLSLATNDGPFDAWSDLAAWPVFLPFLDRLVARLIDPPRAGVPTASPGRQQPRFTGRSLTRWLVAAAALLAIAEWWGAARASRGGIAHAARALVLAVLTAMFFIWGAAPAERPAAHDRDRAVSLVIDTSPSMATADAPHPRAPGTTVPRLEAIRAAFTANGAVLPALVTRGGASLVTADAQVGERAPLSAAGLRSLEPVPPAPRASRIGDAIGQLLADDSPPAAIVVASDGGISAGGSWAEVARTAGSRHVPVVVIPVGDAATGDGSELPAGFRFATVAAPAICQRDERVALSIHAHGATPHPVPIPLRACGSEAALEPVADAAPLLYRFAGRVSGTCGSGAADAAGHTASMTTVTVQAGVTGRHACTVPLVVTSEPIRVLLVDAAPRYEQRFLEQVLAGDPRFTVASCILSAHTTPGARETGALPQSTVEWNAFDVVVLGDLPMAAAEEPAAGAWAALRDAVATDGVGLAWLPGRRWARDDAGLVSWLPAVPRGTGAPREHRLSVSPAGRSDGWFPVLDEARPPRDTFAADVFATLDRVETNPTARVLAWATPAHSAGERARPVPAIVVDRLGAGTVLGHFCETWRWRKDAGDDRHARYWRHALARLAEPHRLARHVAATVAVRPPDPVSDESLVVTIMPTRRTTALAGWTLAIAGGAGPTQRIAVPDSRPGEPVSLRIESLPAGRHTLRLVPPPAGIGAGDVLPPTSIEHDVVVNEPAVERAGGPAGTAPMAAVAAATGGAVVTLDRLAALPDTIAAVERAARAGMMPPPPRWFESQAFAHALLATLVVACLAAWLWHTNPESWEA